MIDAASLSAALSRYLPEQRWFAGHACEPVEIVRQDVLREAEPQLVRVLVRIAGDGPLYQVLIGLRPSRAQATFLRDVRGAEIGDVSTSNGMALAYDAFADPEAAIAFLGHVAPAERVAQAKALAGEQSNSSIVFDDRLILKLFRRLREGPNPDAEVVRALQQVGFDAVPRLVADWREDEHDYAVVNEFVANAVDGFRYALVTLADLRGRTDDVALARAAFADAARRLGETTGRMHAKLAEAFGTFPGDTEAWLDDMHAQLERVHGVPTEAIRTACAALRATADAGPAIRVHGDYHLGQTLHRDHRWYVLDFEGEPGRPLDERRRPTSAMKDVAGMLRSFNYAAEVALRSQGASGDEDFVALARGWEDSASQAFLEGYLRAPGVDAVLPAEESSRRTVLTAFLLDKAVYEVGYEQAYRPDWVAIPLRAIGRLLHHRD